MRFALCLLALTGCGHLGGGPIGLGDNLAFELTDSDGDTIRLRDLRGRVVLVDFWAPWCGPCAEVLPRLADLYARLQADGLEVLAIASMSAPSDVDAFLDEQELPFPILMDPEGELMRRVGLSEVPSWLLIDAYGRVVHVHTPESEDDFWRLEWVVRRGLGQDMVGRPLTAADPP